jgi:hypothetical protein
MCIYHKDKLISKYSIKESQLNFLELYAIYGHMYYFSGKLVSLNTTENTSEFIKMLQNNSYLA